MVIQARSMALGCYSAEDQRLLEAVRATGG
jgi:hypothetical protein